MLLCLDVPLKSELWQTLLTEFQVLLKTYDIQHKLAAMNYLLSMIEIACTGLAPSHLSSPEVKLANLSLLILAVSNKQVPRLFKYIGLTCPW